MKLLDTWQIHEALKYAGDPYDDQYMEWLTRALNYFNLSNNNLRRRWSHGTDGLGEYESELETECFGLAREKSPNPLIQSFRHVGNVDQRCLLDLSCTATSTSDRLEGKESVDGMEEL